MRQSRALPAEGDGCGRDDGPEPVPAVALLVQARPDRTVAQIRAVPAETASDYVANGTYDPNMIAYEQPYVRHGQTHLVRLQMSDSIG